MRQMMLLWTASRTVPTDYNWPFMNLRIVVGGARPADHLPTSRHNILEFSVYPSKDVLRQKLIQAIRSSQGPGE